MFSTDGSLWINANQAGTECLSSRTVQIKKYLSVELKHALGNPGAWRSQSTCTRKIYSLKIKKKIVLLRCLEGVSRSPSVSLWIWLFWRGKYFRCKLFSFSSRCPAVMFLTWTFFFFVVLSYRPSKTEWSALQKKNKTHQMEWNEVV